MNTQWNTSQWKNEGLMFWNHSLCRYMYMYMYIWSPAIITANSMHYIKQLRLPHRLCWFLASLCEPQVTCSYQDAWWSQRELCGGLKLLFHNILPKPPIEHVYWKVPPPQRVLYNTRTCNLQIPSIKSSPNIATVYSFVTISFLVLDFTKFLLLLLLLFFSLTSNRLKVHCPH